MADHGGRTLRRQSEERRVLSSGRRKTGLKYTAAKRLGAGGRWNRMKRAPSHKKGSIRHTEDKPAHTGKRVRADAAALLGLRLGGMRERPRERGSRSPEKATEVTQAEEPRLFPLCESEPRGQAAGRGGFQKPEALRFGFHGKAAKQAKRKPAELCRHL